MYSPAKTHRRWAQPKASVGRILPTDLVDKTLQLLDEYKEVPFNAFLALYHYKYDAYFDIGSLNFDTGLKGFFDQLEESIILKQIDGIWMCYPSTPKNPLKPINGLISNQQPKTSKDKENIDLLIKMVRTRNRLRRMGNLFNRNNTILWTPRFSSLLHRTYHISPSSLESAYRRYPEAVQKEVRMITSVMSRFPDGIPLNRIYTIVNINKRLLGVTSINSLTVEYPELFHRIEPEEDGLQPTVFDGTTNTYSDLYNPDFSKLGINPRLIVYKSILTGIYQKTLLLIRDAGLSGLKLASWYQSVTNKSNFPEPPFRQRYEADLLDMDPISLFQAIASLGLLVIRSHPSCKNDLRLHFPAMKIDFVELMSSVLNQLRAERDLAKVEFAGVIPARNRKRLLSEDTDDQISSD